MAHTFISFGIFFLLSFLEKSQILLGPLFFHNLKIFAEMEVPRDMIGSRETTDIREHPHHCHNI
jgi:hypothetical protein